MEKLFKLSKEKIRLYDDVLSILFPVGFPLSIDILNIRLKSKLPKLTDDEIKSILQSLKLLGIIDFTQPKEVFITPEWVLILQRYSSLESYIKNSNSERLTKKYKPLIIAVSVCLLAFTLNIIKEQLAPQQQMRKYEHLEHKTDSVSLTSDSSLHKINEAHTRIQ